MNALYVLYTKIIKINICIAEITMHPRDKHRNATAVPNWLKNYCLAKILGEGKILKFCFAMKKKIFSRVCVNDYSFSFYLSRMTEESSNKSSMCHVFGFKEHEKLQYFPSVTKYRILYQQCLWFIETAIGSEVCNAWIRICVKSLTETDGILTNQ